MKPSTEFKVQRIRETSTDPIICERPEMAAAYWREHITKADWYDPMKEALVVLALNTRRRIIGHNLVSLGMLDGVSAHPREIFRPLIIIAAHSGILMHNHPSGDPKASEADIRATREFVRAGVLLRINIVDHVIVGEGSFTSLRQLGVIPPE